MTDLDVPTRSKRCDGNHDHERNRSMARVDLATGLAKKGDVFADRIALSSAVNPILGSFVLRSIAKIVSNTCSRLTRSVAPSGVTTRWRFARFSIENVGSNFHSSSQMNRHEGAASCAWATDPHNN